MENKIVVHMKDGAIHKGITHDFDPDADTFHLLPAEGGGVPRRVVVDDRAAGLVNRCWLSASCWSWQSQAWLPEDTSGGDNINAGRLTPSPCWLTPRSGMMGPPWMAFSMPTRLAMTLLPRCVRNSPTRPWIRSCSHKPMRRSRQSPPG